MLHYFLMFQLGKCGIVDAALNWARSKAESKLSKQCSGRKQNKLLGLLFF